MVYSLSVFCLPPVAPVVFLQMVHPLEGSGLPTIPAVLLHGSYHLTDSAA
jgi:hypothetical protein